MYEQLERMALVTISNERMMLDREVRIRLLTKSEHFRQIRNLLDSQPRFHRNSSVWFYTVFNYTASKASTRYIAQITNAVK